MKVFTVRFQRSPESPATTWTLSAESMEDAFDKAHDHLEAILGRMVPGGSLMEIAEERLAFLLKDEEAGHAE